MPPRANTGNDAGFCGLAGRGPTPAFVGAAFGAVLLAAGFGVSVAGPGICLLDHGRNLCLTKLVGELATQLAVLGADTSSETLIADVLTVLRRLDRTAQNSIANLPAS